MLCSCQGHAGPGLLAGVCQPKGINMHSASVTKKTLFFAAVCALLAAAPAKAILFDEAVSGDLSNDKAAPTALTLTPGSNSVIGTVNGFPPGTDAQDWVSFTIPTGFVMTSYVNTTYVSTDPQGFTGFQFGSSFSGNEFLAPSYAGYAHFGTGATNPDTSPPSSTVGVDLLPLMADPSFAPDTTGFTPPLHAGTYTFLIQQGNPVTTSYQFDMNVRSVPEPGSSLCLLGMGALAIFALRRRLGLPKSGSRN
jgi:PEP-CTERM motif-containing protein